MAWGNIPEEEAQKEEMCLLQKKIPAASLKKQAKMFVC